MADVLLMPQPPAVEEAPPPRWWRAARITAKVAAVLAVIVGTVAWWVLRVAWRPILALTVAGGFILLLACLMSSFASAAAGAP